MYSTETLTRSILRSLIPKNAILAILSLWIISVQAQTKPNILLIVGDDVGWGDLGAYGGGVGRGMATPISIKCPQRV